MNDTIKQDAEEFGRHVRQGGWRLGLLVARNVEQGVGGRGRKGVSSPRYSTKISATAFAEQANVGIPKGTKDKPNRDRISVDRVLAYLTAWEKAAEAGLVPAAADLTSGSEVELPAAEAWSEFYTPISGGHNGGSGRTPTKKEAKSTVAKLPAKEKASLVAELLDTPEVIEALDEDEEAVDHVFHATTKIAGSRGKTKKAKKNKSLREMTVVLTLIGVLSEIRDLAKEDSDSPLIKECINLMRETLGILSDLVEADDPEAVEELIRDLENFLAAQQ